MYDKAHTIHTVHRLVTSEHGENYWFNACAKYVMECLNEPDYDYNFFAGLTGDIFTQFYSSENNPIDSISGLRIERAWSDASKTYISSVFSKIGYEAECFCPRDIAQNITDYRNRIVRSIDSGIPVIVYGHIYGVFIGYEESGDIFLYITGDSPEPRRVEFAKFLEDDKQLLVFVGEKIESKNLATLYRDALAQIPSLFGIKTDRYCCGAAAFRAWADDIEKGRFDSVTPDKFESWGDYLNYICVLATNGSCCSEFLNRAKTLNPDLGGFIDELSRLQRRYAQIWGGEQNDNDADNLTSLGGGFNVTLEVLQDKSRRAAIARKIRECAEVASKIAALAPEKMANEIAVCESFEYIKLGKVRFIGIDARKVRMGSVLEEDWNDLWKRSGEFMPALDELAEKHGTNITASCSFMHHNGRDVDSENHYLAGRFFKADTPVPESYDYYDVPTENAAYAVYTTDRYDSSVGAAYFVTRDKVLADGVDIPYPHAYWHAEVYTDGRPHEGNYRFGYLFSVDRRAAARKIE